MVQEVHEQALDVRAVVVLVGHDHEVAVPQRLGVGVHLRSTQQGQRSRSVMIMRWQYRSNLVHLRSTAGTAAGHAVPEVRTRQGRS